MRIELSALEREDLFAGLGQEADYWEAIIKRNSKIETDFAVNQILGAEMHLRRIENLTKKLHAAKD